MKQIGDKVEDFKSHRMVVGAHAMFQAWMDLYFR